MVKFVIVLFVTRPPRGRRLSIRTLLLLLQVSIVVVSVVGVGVVSIYLQQQRIKEASQENMIGVARSVATLPAIVDAMDDKDPAETIQPIAELIRQASGLTYVVVTDTEGIRHSHPNPDRIGQVVSTDPGATLVGEMYTGTQTGSLGRTWRVKLPIRDTDGTIIGMASVGILESDLRSDLLDDLAWLLAALAVATILGTVAAAWVSRLVWRRIHRLEPEEIAALLETRDAMLHGIGEGLVALDQRDRISLINDEAKRLLGVDGSAEGRPAAEVLDASLLRHLDVRDEEGLVLAGERVLLAVRRPAIIDDDEVGSVILLRDRTELRRTLQHLDGARDVAQALRAQSHEFANKLHVISGLIELGRTEEVVSYINRRTGAGTQGAFSAPGIEDHEVEALLLQKGHLGAERGVRLEVDPASRYVFDGTSDVLTVLGNLIDNALDAVESDGTITVRLTEEGDTLVVEVGDNGPGIDAHRRAAIFDAGVTTKTDAESGRARGIGLALVSRVAERRHGRATVEAAPQGGSTFRVELRREPEAAGSR